MPATDAVQLVRSTFERNKEIPAVLDAFGEFVDSPIGPLELQNLNEVFARILDNLSQRFPDAASKRTASTVLSDISAFLVATGNNVERLKEIMKTELRPFGSLMVASIAERFRRMNTEERRAVDATLRVVRRSRVELLFKVNAGKQLTSGDSEFQKYFAIIRSQSPGIRELRYENLIVEKAIFNKLILKSKSQDYFIWVPSFYAVENIDTLIQRDGVVSEHVLLSRLKDLDAQGKLETVSIFLEELQENQGVVSKETEVPQEFSDLLQSIGEYKILQPIDLDDVTAYFREKEERREESLRIEKERERLETEALRTDQEARAQQQREKMRLTTVQTQVTFQQPLSRVEGSIFLGKQLDFNLFVNAINRRVPEGDFPNQVKQIGDYAIQPETMSDIAIVGSSGSGKSVTLKRLLDGMATRSSAKFIVIDQKGEHRGIAWKYKWKVFAFVKDAQASELKVSLFSNLGEDANFVADLIQDWFNQIGFGCSDQQKERIAAIIGEQASNKPSLTTISDLLSKEPELSQLGQKLRRALVLKSSFPKIFFDTGTVSGSLVAESTLFDISGRGLKDPTTREERQMLSILLLRDLAAVDTKNSVIVLEDALDRFKVESLKSRTIQIVQKLRENGNRFLITSRSRTREFMDSEGAELVHRLSGEKVINEEFSEFKTDLSRDLLMRLIGYVPRGYLITSRIKSSSDPGKTSAVKVEPLQFVDARV